MKKLRGIFSARPLRAPLLAAMAALLPATALYAADDPGTKPVKKPWSIYKQSGDTYSYIRADGRANAAFRFLKDGASKESAAIELSKANGCGALSPLTGMCVNAEKSEVRSYYRVSEIGGRSAIGILTSRGLTEKESAEELDSAEKILLSDTSATPAGNATAAGAAGGS